LMIADIKVSQAVKKAEDEVEAVQKKTDATFEQRKFDLEVGLYGHVSRAMGVGDSDSAGPGVFSSLVIPMGEGSKKLRLTAGFGLSPSEGFGWLAGVSLVFPIFKEPILFIGPAFVVTNDLSTMGDDHRDWVAGVGPEVMVHFKWARVSVLPFMGLAPVGLCEDYALKFAGGMLLRIGASLF
jgi:hypothetical protein